MEETSIVRTFKAHPLPVRGTRSPRRRLAALSAAIVGLTVSLAATGAGPAGPGTSSPPRARPAIAAAGASVCTADLDLDGIVGFGDLLTLLSAWGTDEADLDGDGTTGFGDLLVLLSAWGECPPGPLQGITLISPLSTTETVALDLDGNIVQTWVGATAPAAFAYLRPDGGLIRPCVVPGGLGGGGAGGRIQMFDADGTLEWDYLHVTEDYQQHHDIAVMPNGNLLLIVWERKTAQEAIDMGRVNVGGEFLPDMIVEVEPDGPTGGNIVWEWYVWDHLVQDVDPGKPGFGVVSEHPELIDINFGPANGGDFNHMNSIDYYEPLDQIVVSSRTFDEFWVIDHSTTTEEAAGHTGGNRGHGGDLLYRWGNPLTYGRGGDAERYYHVIHGAQWIQQGPGAGNVITFNNGNRPGISNDYSTVAEIVPPRNGDGGYILAGADPFGPAAPTWEHGDPGDFYGGPTQCGAFRLSNGNTIICLRMTGYVFEVAMDGTLVWDYDHPSSIARAPKYWLIDGKWIGP